MSTWISKLKDLCYDFFWIQGEIGCCCKHEAFNVIHLYLNLKRIHFRTLVSVQMMTSWLVSFWFLFFQEIRELQELQRTLYTFLHVIATHDLSPIFLSPRGQGYLDPMMQLLLYASCYHNGIAVRKVCTTTFLLQKCLQPLMCFRILRIYVGVRSIQPLLCFFFQACVQIIIRLIKDWCTRPYSEEKVSTL